MDDQSGKVLITNKQYTSNCYQGATKNIEKAGDWNNAGVYSKSKEVGEING